MSLDLTNAGPGSRLKTTNDPQPMLRETGAIEMVARSGRNSSSPSDVSARGATWNLFPLLGVPAAIGHTFLESEDRPDGNGDVRKPLQLLMCAVACLLLIGCLNIANLLVARGAARQKEGNGDPGRAGRSA